MYSLLPLLTLIVPLLAGTLCLFTCLFRFLEEFSRRTSKILLLTSAALSLVTPLTMIPYCALGEVLETTGLGLRADLSNIAALVSTAILFFLVSIYNMGAERGGRLKPGLYNFFLLLFLCCMFGLLLSYDLFGIFLFVELVIGVSIILVAHNPVKESTEAAFKYLIITAISALFVLIGVLVIYVLTGESNILHLVGDSEKQAILAENPRLLMFVVACFIIGLGADIGLVPFHGWLPDCLPASTIIINGFTAIEPIPLILALYKLVAPLYRIYPSNVILALMLGTGLISIVFGALMAYSQKNFFRMIAYCSIDEYGHSLFALSLISPEARSFLIGQFYLINSTLAKTGLILSLGSVYFNSGDSVMDSLGNLIAKMDKTALSYMVCALSLTGIPPLSGFYAKLLFFGESYRFFYKNENSIIATLIVALLVCISIISFIFLIRSFHKIFLGKSRKNIDVKGDVPILMWLPTIIIATATLILGIRPDLLLRFIGPA
ncbi:MAG: complex I subunit 5 family protein [Candidatus Bathyarchaeota archaeon]|nr:complex I subunit 5 family protein [Candidatus Bathyarchaeota archaeon]